MENRIVKIRSWISASFQLITVVLLTIAITLLVKQQSDMSRLEKRIKSIDSNLDDVSNNLDDAERNLLNEIDEVKSTVRIWSH